ncbi:MAG: hypothetical protein KMY54_04595, partial [Erysipelothrix sp.]|nr:hypothetical protein [Erysipelothrix sp.]
LRFLNHARDHLVRKAHFTNIHFPAHRHYNCVLHQVFVQKNMETLKLKKLGIFFCCGFEENLQTYLEANFEKDLVKDAIVMTMGGEMDVSKMSFAHKMITRMVQKSEQGKNRNVELHLGKVDEFVAQMFSQTE